MPNTYMLATHIFNIVKCGIVVQCLCVVKVEIETPLFHGSMAQSD